MNEWIEISKLNEASYNPRRISNKEMESLIKSIKYHSKHFEDDKYRLSDNIIVNKHNNVIVGGHKRIKALKKLNQDVIHKDDIKWINIKNENDEKALNLALNRIKGSFNHKKVNRILKDLFNVKMDLTITGFDSIGIDKEEKEIQFTEELLEEHNYIVLYFDNEIDWLQALSLFRIEQKKALDSKNGFEKIGIGRVINGSEAIERIKNEN